MTFTLQITDELTNRLEDEARKLGLDIPEYVVHVLTEAFQVIEENPISGAQLVEYWRNAGVIGARPDIEDSQTHARAIRASAERRNRG